MISHPKWTWVHTPKTAGNAIARTLVAYPGIEKAVFGHVPWEHTVHPEAPLLAFVRDPWTYYPSLYRYLHWGASLGAYDNTPMGVFRSGFAEATDRALDLGGGIQSAVIKLTGLGTGRQHAALKLARYEDGVLPQLNDFLLRNGCAPVTHMQRANQVPSNMKQVDTAFTSHLIARIRKLDALIIDMFDYPTTPAK